MRKSIITLFVVLLLLFTPHNVIAEDPNVIIRWDSGNVEDTEEIKTMISMTPICAMAMGSNPEVGRIDWCDGKIKFIGDFEESAKIYYEYFWNMYINPEWRKYLFWKKNKTCAPCKTQYVVEHCAENKKEVSNVLGT